MVRTREEWEKLQAGGRNRYLLVRGVLGRGLPMAAAVILLLEALQGNPIDGSLFMDPGFHQRLLIATALFSVGGVAGAYTRWRAMEIRFREGKESAR